MLASHGRKETVILMGENHLFGHEFVACGPFFTNIVVLESPYIAPKLNIVVLSG